MKKILIVLLFAPVLLIRGQLYNAGANFSIYKDIKPDTLLHYTIFPYSHNTFGIKLFDDLSADIQITASGAVSPGGTGAYISVLSLNKNVFIRFGRMDSVYIPAYKFWDVTKVALPLNKGEAINSSSAIWDTTLLYLTDHSGYGGGTKNVNDWVGGDKYIGLKYQKGTTVKYGWIRVQCVSEDSCFIKDYSYMSSPLAVMKSEQSETRIFPNPFRDSFSIMNLKGDEIDISNIRITDIYGKEVKFGYEIRSNEVKFNLESNIPDGCYLLRCYLNNETVTGKFVKLND